MHVTLKPELQQFIDEQVRLGRFATREDVIEAGLGRLRGDDFGDFQPGELDALIETAEDQFRHGNGHTLEEVRRHFGAKG